MMSRNAKRLSGLHRFLFRIKKKLISLNYDNLMKPYIWRVKQHGLTLYSFWKKILKDVCDRFSDKKIRCRNIFARRNEQSITFFWMKKSLGAISSRSSFNSGAKSISRPIDTIEKNGWPYSTNCFTLWNVSLPDIATPNHVIRFR